MTPRTTTARPAPAQPSLADAEAHYKAGRLDAADGACRRVLDREPDNAEALYLMATVARGRGELDRALALVGQAVAARPDVARFHGARAMMLEVAGDTDAAIAAYRRALELKPDAASVHFRLGNLYLARRDHDAAAAAYRRAIALRPGFADAHNRLGLALRDGRRPDAAAAAYRAAVRADPGRADFRIDLADALEEAGETAAALAAYRRALAVRADAGVAVRRALVLPRIPPSAAGLERARRRFDGRLAALPEQGLALADPVAEVGATCFHLAYHGKDDRGAMTRLARFYLDACPSLAWCAAPARRRAGSRIRVGFISRYFRSHAVALCFRGLIERLDRDAFEVVVLTIESRSDAVTRAIAATADRTVRVPYKLEAARRAVAEAGLDVLVYTDIGMEPLTYFLAFARLAPAQLVLTGHPVTTGIPNVDAFVTNHLAEPADAAAHYSERLVRIRRNMLYYRRPALPESPRPRESFGFEAGEHLYACPQNVIKIHPEFDAVLAAILRRDPAGRVVLIECPIAPWNALLRRRLARTMGDVADRVRWLPHLAFDDFLALVAAADVVLDPLHFGGGNTGRQALALGKPVVTLPCRFMRGRLTYAHYRRMGVDGCVARDTADYVDIAVGLATDAAQRRAVGRRIAESSRVLFDDIDGVREVEAVLADAAAGRLS